ncbi:hypothetical protein BH11MYX1_BH11MYX1_24180 [soil metagenome]
MIQRFMFVKLLETDVESRASLALRLRAEFQEAGAEALVGLPADESAVKWDLSIVVTAASLDAWHVLSQTAAIEAIVAEVRALAKVEKAWTFDVGSALGDDDAFDADNELG